jgi:putative ABC transport system permease protein
VRLSNLLHLYRIRVRARLVQELLALVGIAVGVALLYAASVANTSLTESVARLTAGIVGDARFQVEARSADGFDERLLGRVERLPGVWAAAPMLDLQANVVGPGGRRSVLLVGGDPRFARLGGAFVRAFRSDEFARQRVVALPAPLARSLGLSLGGAGALEIAGRRRETVVGALLDRPDVGDLAASPVVIAPLAYVQELAGLRGRVTRVYVMPAPGRARQVEAGLRGLAGDRLNVRPALFDVQLFDKAALPTHASTTLFFAFSAGIGFLFAFSAMLLTVPQRRRLIGDLRADGFGPRVVLQVLALDALVLGVVASAVGIGLGELLSRALFSSTPGYLGYTFPIGSERIVGARSVLIAAAGGLLAATAAVVAPYGRVGSRSRRSADEDRGSALVVAVLLGCALVALAVTTAVLAAAPQLAILGMASLTLAGLLLLPVAIRGLLALLERLTYRWKDAAPFIALVQLRSREHRFRAGAIAATGTVALLSCVAIQGARADLQRGLDAAVRDIDSTADVWVTAAGESNTFATTALATNTARGLARLPGVEAVRSYRGSFLDWGNRRVWVLAPPSGVAAPVPASQVGDVADRARASDRIRVGGWAVLSHQLAEDHDLKVGERFTLPAPVPLVLRVAALSTNLGWPPGAVILNAGDYARGWGSTAASAYQLTVVPGASSARVSAAARRELGGAGAPLVVETAREREERHYASTRAALARLTQIRTLVLGAAVLAMAAALIGLIWQRRPRLARLKVDGFSDAEVRRALIVEALVLVGGGAMLGAMLGLYGQVLLDRALSTITGFPVFVSVGVVGAIAGAALVTAAAVAIVSVPGALAARTDARPASGDDR